MSSVLIQNNKQQGSTLITALMMLLVMTIIGISAVKMSSINIIIAGNDQQKLMLKQVADTKLINLATPVKLLPPLLDNTLFVETDGRMVYTTPDVERLSPLADEYITDMGRLYGCEGIGGKAVSVGTPCKLFDFKIIATTALGLSKEERSRGAGKEVPATAKYSLLNVN